MTLYGSEIDCEYSGWRKAHGRSFFCCRKVGIGVNSRFSLAMLLRERNSDITLLVETVKVAVWCSALALPVCTRSWTTCHNWRNYDPPPVDPERECAHIRKLACEWPKDINWRFLSLDSDFKAVSRPSLLGVGLTIFKMKGAQSALSAPRLIRESWTFSVMQRCSLVLPVK